MAVILGSCLGEVGTMCVVKCIRAGCFILNMFSLLMPDCCLLMSLPLTWSHLVWPWGPGDPAACHPCQRGSVPSCHRSGVGDAVITAFMVIDHGACIEQAQLYILCQVHRLLITLLLTLYHIGQCLTDRGICLFGIYLPLWHKSNMIRSYQSQFLRLFTATKQLRTAQPSLLAFTLD